MSNSTQRMDVRVGGDDLAQARLLDLYTAQTPTDVEVVIDPAAIEAMIAAVDED